MPRKKKLLLINPFNQSTRDDLFDTNTISPPLGLGIVAALTPANWDVEILDENFTTFEYQDADLVGFTALTSAVNRAYEIAALYRQKGIKTVIGGIHVSMLPEEALDYVDAVVVGEAESAWPQLIEDFEQGDLKSTYKGELLPLDHTPWPRRDLFHPGYLYANIQTTRGCPMQCDFCSVHVFNGNCYRQRPVEDVLDELETIPQERLFIIDDNIIGYNRASAERGLALFKGMVERGIKKDWICQASMNIAQHEDVLHYAAESGCRMILIGIESEKIDQLEETNKKMNLKIGVENYSKVFDTIHKHGISVLGAFIYGLDTDSLQDLENRTTYTIETNIDAIQATIVTPLPGTSLFNRLARENRLIYTDFPTDWEHYHFLDVVFEPKLMKPDELKEAMHKNWARMWDLKTLQKKMLKTIKATKNPKAAIFAYFANLERHNTAFGNRRKPIDLDQMLRGLENIKDN